MTIDDVMYLVTWLVHIPQTENFGDTCIKQYFYNLLKYVTKLPLTKFCTLGQRFMQKL